jgi:hypothetical protein
MAVWRAIAEGFEIHQKVDMGWEVVEILQGGGGSAQASLGEIKLLEWRQNRPGETFRLIRRNSWELDESIKVK